MPTPPTEELVMPQASRFFLIGVGQEMGGELEALDRAVGELRTRKADPALIKLAEVQRADHYRMMRTLIMIGSTKLHPDPPTNPPAPPPPTLRQRFARWLLGV